MKIEHCRKTEYEGVEPLLEITIRHRGSFWLTFDAPSVARPSRYARSAVSTRAFNVVLRRFTVRAMAFRRSGSIRATIWMRFVIGDLQ